MDAIEKEPGSARHALLDLTMRNRLLNFKSSRNRTVQVIDEIPSQIYDRLVTCTARSLGFQARSKGISKRIGDVMANMMQQNRLHILSGDMVDLVR